MLVWLINAYRKGQPIFMDEGFKRNRRHCCVMLENRVEPDHNDIGAILKSGLTIRIGAPGQSGGSLGEVPAGMSLTFKSPGQAVSSLRMTQCACQRSRLVALGARFDASSKSGWKVAASTTTP